MSNVRVEQINLHTLYQGDCLKIIDDGLIKENSVDCIITDPPYFSKRVFTKDNWESEIAFKPETWQKMLKVLKDGGLLLSFGAAKNFYKVANALDNAGFEIRDTILWVYKNGMPKSAHSKVEGFEKYASLLRPAYEAIILARKPFKGSLSENVKKNGTGLLNVEDTRIGKAKYKDVKANYSESSVFGKRMVHAKEGAVGRYPSNIIVDDSDIYLSRYFMVCKATKEEKNLYVENTHNTVKPLELMRYLVKLLGVKNAVILDPFMGSGSTGVAVIQENDTNAANYKFIGVELENSNFEIALKRIAGSLNQGNHK